MSIRSWPGGARAIIAKFGLLVAGDPVARRAHRRTPFGAGLAVRGPRPGPHGPASGMWDGCSPSREVYRQFFGADPRLQGRPAPPLEPEGVYFLYGIFPCRRARATQGGISSIIWWKTKRPDARRRALFMFRPSEGSVAVRSSALAAVMLHARASTMTVAVNWIETSEL